MRRCGQENKRYPKHGHHSNKRQGNNQVEYEGHPINDAFLVYALHPGLHRGAEDEETDTAETYDYGAIDDADKAKGLEPA